jgi:GH35 family endo-1,4-beta-xylanase
MEHTQPTAGQEMDDPTLASGAAAPGQALPALPVGYLNPDVPLARPAREPRWSPVVKWLLGAQIILLLALAQVMWAGYRLGVGNQTIQIPFLKRSIDSQLYKGDAMVEQTLPFYSSYFYKGVAKIVAWVEPMAKPDAAGRIPFDPVTSVYFWLHVLTAAAALAAAYALGRAMFKSRAAGVVLLLIMLAGHHRALAGDDLYSVGFTHTWAVFPLAIAAMGLLYVNRWFLAFALLGIIFNLHALTAAYLFVMFGAWSVLEFPRPRQWWRLIIMAGLFGLIALPTVSDMIRQKQVFTPQWMELTRVRSADHSFPSSWWADGSTDIPRFLLIAGLAAVGFSFTTDASTRRKSIGMLLGAGLLFLIGTVFTEIWPMPTVIRAQLFRASRLVVVVMLAHVAYGVVRGWGMLLTQRAPEAESSGDVPSVTRWGGFLEAIVATAMFACVFVEGMFDWTPWVLLAAMLVALVNGRLSKIQAAISGMALLVCLIAWRQISLHIPGLNQSIGQVFHTDWMLLKRKGFEAGPALALAIGVAIGAWVLMRLRTGPRVKLCGLVAIGFICTIVALYGYRDSVWNGGITSDPWVQAQLWASKYSPRDAVFLTPPQQGGFRIYSERPVVGEWRDGTQLYFASQFAEDWGKKMSKLRPVILDSGGREISRGESIEDMSDDKLVKLCREMGAHFVVLPAPAPEKKRKLRAAYENEKWVVYEPQMDVAKIEVPQGANPTAWREQEEFLENIARPNIEKHRKGDASVELVDESGKPVVDGSYTIRLINHAFNFGCSLPPFEDLTGGYTPEWTSPPVTPLQLERVKEVFNYSVIPFSGKWHHLEPLEGQRNYEELDKYVEWCVKNNVRMEFHYLSGFMPPWARRKSSAEQIAAWKRHCMATVDRYADRIKVWQVVNDSYLIDYAADVFTEIRKKHPDLKLGISHCSKFYTGEYEGGRGSYTGMDDLDTLKASGVKVDFFAAHGHAPHGAWPDAKSMYRLIESFADYGVKVHISEATLDLGLRMFGPLRDGMWTPESAADFWEQYYTVAFSHPACDAINYWDISASVPRGFGGDSSPTRMPGGTGAAGLLDVRKNDTPQPAFLRLKHLIKEVWTTKVDGRLSTGGKVAFRGFYGDYEVVVNQASGKVLRGKLAVKREGDNRVKVQLSAENGASVVVRP